MMPSLGKKEYCNSEFRKESLQNLADVCKKAYQSGVTLDEVKFVSGAAWADYLDPRES